MHVGKEPDAVALSADGSFAYVATYAANSVSMINTSTDKVIGTTPVGPAPYSIATVPAQPGSQRVAWSRGISCLASGYCLAVGSRATPDRHSRLGRASANCTAVGTANLLPVPVLGFPAGCPGRTWREVERQDLDHRPDACPGLYSELAVQGISSGSPGACAAV